MQRKNRLKLPIILITSSLLTSCSGFFQKKTEELAIKLAMNLPYVVNVVNVKDQKLEDNFDIPNAKSKQKDIKYLQNALAIPQSIVVEQYGVTVDFTTKIITEKDLFVFTVGEFNLEGTAKVEARVLLPIGEGEFSISRDQSDIKTIEDAAAFLNEGKFTPKDIITISKQDAHEIVFEVTGTIGSYSVSKKYYFKINPITLNEILETFNIKSDDVGISQEIIDLIDDWSSTPPKEVTDTITDKWPDKKPENITEENWPEELPQEWIEEGGWPTDPEVVNDFIEENWPDELPEDFIDALPDDMDIDFNNLTPEETLELITLLSSFLGSNNS